ncbi:ABC transporter substrate-binding protein [Candidatus Desantisbacteria bacterium]|nr:ABC transporter substrate-binding protein [Candidatus Desantisbacteria bacterium]
MSNCKIKLFLLILFLLYTNSIAYSKNIYPERIISLSPSITEQLYLLGAQDKIIGVTTYCLNPPDAQKKEKVGTVIDVNIEKILSLKSDLVITTPLTNIKAKEKFNNLGIKNINFPQAKNFTELCSQFLKLGSLTGEKDTAEEIIKKTKIEIDLIKKTIKHQTKPKVFIQLGAKPLFTITKDSFINDFIEFAGGINIYSRTETGLCSREDVLGQNPDVIIIINMGIISENEKNIWNKYKTINAVENKRIYILDAYSLCSPTPVSFVETLKKLVEIFNHANK